MNSAQFRLRMQSPHKAAAEASRPKKKQPRRSWKQRPVLGVRSGKRVSGVTQPEHAAIKKNA